MHRQITKMLSLKHISPKFIPRVYYSSTGTMPLTTDNMNQTIKEVNYAVRGPIVARALEIENDLKKVSHYILFRRF